jgi:hypothetical protein
MPLDVPYIRQTRIATCGPACLMMVIKYYDPTFDTTTRTEHRLWIQSLSLSFLGGTLPAGLATTAQNLHYHATIHQQAPLATYHPKTPHLTNLISYTATRRAHHHHIPIHNDTNLHHTLTHAIDTGIPPIVLINLKPLNGENVLHWIVATGHTPTTITINDPYLPHDTPEHTHKNQPIPHALFQHAMATDTGRHLRLPPTIILIQPTPKKPSPNEPTF